MALKTSTPTVHYKVPICCHILMLKLNSYMEKIIEKNRTSGWSTQNMSHLISNLFGLDSVNYGIRHRWNQDRHIGQQNMDIGYNMVSKSLSECCEDPRTIKENNDKIWEPQVFRAFWRASWDGIQNTEQRINMEEMKVSTISRSLLTLGQRIRTRYWFRCHHRKYEPRQVYN